MTTLGGRYASISKYDTEKVLFHTYEVKMDFFKGRDPHEDILAVVEADPMRTVVERLVVEQSNCGVMLAGC